MRMFVNVCVAGLVAAGLGIVSSAKAMPVTFTGAAAPASGAIAIPVESNGTLTGAADAADRSAAGAIRRAIAAADFKGTAGTTLTLYSIGPYSRVILVGVGDGADTRTELEELGGRIAIAAEAGRAETIAVLAPGLTAIPDSGALVALGARLGSYAWGRVGAPAQPDPARRLSIHVPNAQVADRAWTGTWQPVADGVKLARDLISTPSNIKTPQWFVEQVQAAFSGAPNVTITVIDEQEAARLGMGGLVGVGQGSPRPPRMLAVHYRGAGTSAPIAFVGKGITFDTGGISLKDGEGMWRMRYDMSGAAASVGAVLAAARRGARANVVAVVALAENMPDGNAIRPGDVLTAMDGQTMEILNTDAEGRVVLADANVYAHRTFAPSLIVNIATLTGAARGALGDDYAALFARTDATASRVAAAGEQVGEFTWRLPLHPSTFDDLRSDVATMRNVVEGGAPGASIGAAFLANFIPAGQDWAHLDIAPVAWRNSRTPNGPTGAVGYGVKLFDELVRREEAR